MKRIIAHSLVLAMVAGCAAQPSTGFVVKGVTAVGLDGTPLRDEPNQAPQEALASADSPVKLTDCFSIPHNQNEEYLRCLRNARSASESESDSDSEPNETAKTIGKAIGYTIAAPFFVAAVLFNFSYEFALAVVEARYGSGGGAAYQTSAVPSDSVSSGVDAEGRPWSCAGDTCGSANIYIPPNRRAAWTTPPQ